MSYRSKANSSPSERILSQTLTHVRGRRRRRQQVRLAVAIPVILVAAIVLRWDFSLPSNTPEIVETEEPVFKIQRVGRESETRVSRIERSSHLGEIERLAGVSSSPKYILRINDGQLLASLPEGKTAGLLRGPDGTSRLLWIEESVPKR